MNSEDDDDTFDIIHSCLVDASMYNLTTEVVYFALRYMKQNPDKTIKDAISYGYWEWVK